ncbi:MAG: aryl-sulfate sulfotransferase [Myxococcales bacterium]|nr:aryl-sulfate sulfotransferase [Myxococcales bacterium]
MTTLALVIACAPSVQVVEPPRLEEQEGVPLARLLTVTTDAPSQLEVVATADDERFRVRWPEVRTDHEVALLGLKADRTWTVDVRLLDTLGRTTEAGQLTVQTIPVPEEDFGIVDVRAHDPERAEPGYRLANVRGIGDDGFDMLVAWDIDDLEVAWLAVDDGFSDVRMTPEGTLVGIRSSTVPSEVDFLRRVIRRWSPDSTAPDSIVLEANGAHHELYPFGDGSFLSLTNYLHTSPAYPDSYDLDAAVYRQADLTTSRVIRFAADGSLIWDFPLADVLDDSRIGFGSLETTLNGLDWTHANAVIPDPDGGVLVSLRHQDAVIKLDETGQLVWILGDPAGWSDAHAPYLLEMTGGGRWHYHAHAPAFDADGLLLLFDNHNHGRTPYEAGSSTDWASRVVAYRIDEATMTVEEAWSYHPPGPEMQVSRMGDADPLLQTGNVLANFAYVDALNQEQELVSLRLVEFDPADPERPVLDLWVRRPNSNIGVRSFRGESIPSLYADDVVFEKL